MSTNRLTTTSYVVLGYLAQVAEATPYEMKNAVAGSIGYFWSFPHSQLYSEPSRLVSLGLVSERREDGGRRRRLFAITDDGRAELRDWLARPVTGVGEVRDEATMQLFFAAADDYAHLPALARAQIAAHTARLQVYRSLVDDTMPKGPAAALRHGLSYESHVLAFWQDVLDREEQGHNHNG